MYSDILRTIAGIEVYPVLSLVLFVTVFSVVLIWAARADRARLDRFAAIPLDEGLAAGASGSDTQTSGRRKP
jgi:cytochrome c oxidase cbb3-type subunit IV